MHYLPRLFAVKNRNNLKFLKNFHITILPQLVNHAYHFPPLGVTPERFCDEVSGKFRSLFEKCGISFTDFIRTTEPRHKVNMIVVSYVNSLKYLS